MGSSAEKIIPISKRVLGTMAGSAADCVSWLRLLSALSKLHELNTRAAVLLPKFSEAARTLGSLLRRRRGDDYGVGTMVFDSDALYYVDGEGYELKGSAFAVGSGSVYAYPALEANLDGLVDAAAALEIAERAVATAAVRDACSGGLLNLCVAERVPGLAPVVERHAHPLLNTCPPIRLLRRRRWASCVLNTSKLPLLLLVVVGLLRSGRKRLVDSPPRH